MTEDLYRIGAVAKRTGISPECLRAWERRYGLEPAERAGKTRFYDSDQIERLTTIKALLDQGHPISQVIHLPTDALERRLAPRPSVAAGASVPRVALVGTALVRAYRDAESERRLEAVTECAGVADLFREALPAELDCVIVYLPSLDAEEIEKIKQFFQTAYVLVTFRYATAADLAACRTAGHPLLRWPAEWARVEELALAGLPHGRGDAGRRFSDDELLHISIAASRGPCDCARDLAALIGELNDYAAHVRRCGGDDGHDLIEREVRSARARLEEALASEVERHGLMVTAN